MLFSFATASGVLYTPALPDLMDDFGLSNGEGQWTMTLFLLGFALGHLIYGPLANAIGRKKALYFGLGISFIGTCLCFFTESYPVFCLGRFIQALGAASGLKIMFTMTGDLYSREKAAKMISYLLMGIAIAQGLGPAVGGFLTMHFGWQGCFGFLIFYTLFLILLSLFLPETAAVYEREALKPKKIFQGYLVQFKDPFIMLHAAILGLCTATLYIFATEAPFIGIDVFGLSPTQYGMYFSFLVIAMLLGSFIGKSMIGKVRPRIAMISAILLNMISIIVMALFFVNGLENSWTLFVPFFFIQIGSFIAWIFASAKGLSEATNKSNASAVMQFTCMAITTLGTFFSGAFFPKTPLTLAAIFGAIIFLEWVVWLQLKEHHLRSPH